MTEFFWKLRAMYYYMTIMLVPMVDAYSMSESLYEGFGEDGLYTPKEAVLEDLTYWGD